MTTRKQELSERLLRDFEVCDRHILRIKEALQGLSVEMPLTFEVYCALTSEQVRCIDQFIFRFSKLQDAMGAKIFRNLLAYWDEDIVNLPMRDVLDRLERYRIIPSVNDWVYIRELRNELSHDYPLQETDVVAVLNELFRKVNVLLDIYDKIKGAVLKEGEIPF